MDTTLVVIVKILAVYVGSIVLWVMLSTIWQIFLSIFYAMFNIGRKYHE